MVKENPASSNENDQRNEVKESTAASLKDLADAMEEKNSGRNILDDDVQKNPNNPLTGKFIGLIRQELHEGSITLTAQSREPPVIRKSINGPWEIDYTKLTAETKVNYQDSENVQVIAFTKLPIQDRIEFDLKPDPKNTLEGEYKGKIAFKAGHNGIVGSLEFKNPPLKRTAIGEAWDIDYHKLNITRPASLPIIGKRSKEEWDWIRD